METKLALIGLFLFCPFIQAKLESKKLLTENISAGLICIKDPIDTESSNSFLLTGDLDGSFLTDAGWSETVEIPKDLSFLIENSCKVTTHFHFDHILQLHKMNNIFLTEQQYQTCREHFCSSSR